MFTGIIEETGTVKLIKTSVDGGSITVGCRKVLENTKVGDSIAVNGICLTVTNLAEDFFTADVMSETLNRTSLKELHSNSPVNLERAMGIDSRFGGHMVSGHIDGTGKVIKMENQGIAFLLSIESHNKIVSEVIEKGSIAIDGISLTVAKVTKEYFTVSLIPHTIKETNLHSKRVGSTVNLETDIIGKYVKHFLKQDKKEDVDFMSLLEENGFLN